MGGEGKEGKKEWEMRGQGGEEEWERREEERGGDGRREREITIVNL